MSSTSTFQGMNTDTKPSSRVLAPPGGGSSNIFGSPEPTQPQPKKETAPSTKPVEPAPVSQSTQGDRFVRAAPKQGEDSFQNLFGSEKCLDYKNSSASSNQSSPSTFDSLFGHSNAESRKKSATMKSANSFNRLFGDQDENHRSGNVSKGACKKLENLSINNPSSHCTQIQSSSDLDSSFHRVFGGHEDDSTSARSNRYSDINSAFNPITGQPYDMPEQDKKDASKEEEGKENEQKPDTAAQPAPAAAKEKSSTRVAQPPGGKSSGPLW